MTARSEDVRAVMRLRGLAALLSELVPQRVEGPQRDPELARSALEAAGFLEGPAAEPPTFEQMMSVVARRSRSRCSQRRLRKVEE